MQNNAQEKFCLAEGLIPIIMLRQNTSRHKKLSCDILYTEDTYNIF